MLPWEYSIEELEETLAYYPGQEEAATISLNDFNYNSYKVPGLFCFAIYMAFIAMIVGNGVALSLLRYFPSIRQAKSVQWLRAHSFKSPIAGTAHHEPFHPLGRWFFSLRLPLRFEFIVVVALLFVNVLPLAGLYRITPADVNVFWPGPTSHRDQLARYIADRSAILAIGQVPLVILMAGRNSPIAAISGLDFNSLMLWHRWIARMTWLQVNVHSFAYTAIGIQTKTLSASLAEAYWRWGCVATAMWWGLTILAITELRKRAYEVWLVGHIVLAVVGLVGTYFHIALLESTAFYPYIILIYISAAVWAFDRVVRVARRAWLALYTAKSGQGLMTQATAEAFRDVTRLTIAVPASCLIFLDDRRSRDASKTGLRRIAPGHAIRLLAPKVDWVSDHPFTVCETSRSSTDAKMGQMTLLVRSYGGMTKRLSAQAAAAADKAEGQDLENQSSAMIRTPVIVEGPYGDLHDHLADSDVVVLFAGGIGVTFCMPLLTKIVLSSSSKHCKLVWNIKSLSFFVPIQEQLLRIVALLRTQDSTAAFPVAIELHVTEPQEDEDAVVASLTKEGESAPRLLPSAEQDRSKYGSDKASDKGVSLIAASELQPYFIIDVKQGRSSTSIQEHLGSLQSIDRSLGVAACGPASLCDDVRADVKKALLSRQWAEVDHVEECFSW